MYDKIGKKIKILTQILTIISVIASIIVGFVYIAGGLLIGLIFILLCPVLIWISSFFMYAFGELVDKVCDIEKRSRGGISNIETEQKSNNERREKIEQLHAWGMISEEEYNDAISKDE